MLDHAYQTLDDEAAPSHRKSHAQLASAELDTKMESDQHILVYTRRTVAQDASHEYWRSVQQATHKTLEKPSLTFPPPTLQK